MGKKKFPWIFSIVMLWVLASWLGIPQLSSLFGLAFDRQSVAVQNKPTDFTPQFVAYGDNGRSSCGGYCNDIRPEKRHDCSPHFRPAYDEDGWCDCQFDPVCG